VTPETRSDAKVDRLYVRKAWTDLGSHAEEAAKEHQLALHVPDNLGFPRGRHVDVDLRAYRHRFGEVNPGLDREAGAGDDQALVSRFEVVDVGAVPVDGRADRMPGAVQEVLAVACTLHDLAARVVHLVPMDRLPC